MTRTLLILFVALCFEAVGVVLLSKGLKQLEPAGSWHPREILGVVGRGAANPWVVLGVLFEALFFSGLLYLMSRSDVSFLWPLTSLSFVLTALAARFFLQEQVSGFRWGGVVLIMCGVAMIIYSEHRKNAPVPPIASAESPGLNQPGEKSGESF